MKRKWLPLFICMLGLVDLIGTSALAAGSSIGEVQSPCTPEESWQFSSLIPQTWVDRFHAIPPGSGPRDYYALYANARYLHDKAKIGNYRALGEYQIGRALVGLHEPHLAAAHFNAVLLYDAPAANGVKDGALACLAKLHQASPDILLEPKSLQSSASRQPELVLASAENWIFSGNTAGVDAASGLLGEPYKSYLAALRSAKAGDRPGILLNGEKFLAYDHEGDGLPPSLQSRANAVRMLIGEILYEERKFDEAATQFRAVDSDSNYLAQALTALGWSRLLSKRYPDSVSAARNLLSGALRETFAPEAGIVAAIAFLETCHYAEAIQSAKHFQKSYWSSYNWLYKWRKSQIPEHDLYPLLMKYLTKKAKLPSRIASEWMRSPVFLRSQSELNVLYDERDAARKLIPGLAAYARTHRRLAPILSHLSSDLAQQLQASPAREQWLLATMNRDLAQRSEAMLASVADVWNNSQLLEVDTYNQAGEKMISDRFSANDVKIAKNRIKQNESQPPVWDWGRAPSDDDTSEVWEDEIGFLRTDLTNSCVKPRS